MSSHDLKFRDATPYDVVGKYPYIYFADCEIGSFLPAAYANNSLEGAEFDQLPLTTGTVSIPNPVNMDYKYMDAMSPVSYVISDVVITEDPDTGIRTCTVTTTAPHSYAVGDIVAITGVDWDDAHPSINGTWTVYSIAGDLSTFDFETKLPVATSYSAAALISGSSGVALGPVFQIADYRSPTDARGKSFTSTLFTLKNIYAVPTATFTRILPSDLYTRFRFQTGSDIDPQGGINSNLFNVVDTAGNNVKPVLWAYFFGYSDSTIVTRTSTHFEIAFNSYAIVLRPSGSGSNLEFAIVKFNWGLIPDSSAWNGILGTDYFKLYGNDVFPGSALGYLISTNPDVGKTTTFSPVTELAKSDSFTYNSEFPVKLNLKISIRKHLLSDSQLDGTYLVNLMINDDYDKFGEGEHYDSILHTYISKPSPTSWTITGNQPDDSMLMPMMYFKFNNINEQNVNDPVGNPPGSSKIVQDSLFFRQLNSNASYLY
jgi:hypothetical protein